MVPPIHDAIFANAKIIEGVNGGPLFSRRIFYVGVFYNPQYVFLHVVWYIRILAVKTMTSYGGEVGMVIPGSRRYSRFK